MADGISSVSAQHAVASQLQADEVQAGRQAQAASVAEAEASSADYAEMSKAELEALAEQLNEFMKKGQRSLSFSVDETADEVVISVLDKQTQELIRQIPSPEALKLKQHFDSVIGLLFSDQA